MSVTLKIQTEPVFTVPVDISIAGKSAPRKLETDFKYLTRSELKDFWARVAAGMSDEDALSEIIVSFRGYEKPYSREVLEEVIEKYPAAAADFFRTFRRELMESKQKN